MVEAIAPGNYEAAAITWLTGKLGTGVAIHTKVPAPRPEKFVKVIRTGGHRLDLAYYEAQLTFECWATNEDDAGDIANLAYGNLFAAAGQEAGSIFIRKVVEVGGIVNSQDPESTTCRYMFTAGVQGRMAVL